MISVKRSSQRSCSFLVGTAAVMLPLLLVVPAHAQWTQDDVTFTAVNGSNDVTPQGTPRHFERHPYV